MDESCRAFLAEKGFDPKNGARPVNRILQTEIEDRLTDLILDESVKEGDTILFSKKKAGVKVTIRSPKEEALSVES